MSFLESDHMYHKLGWFQREGVALPIIDCPNLDPNIMNSLLDIVEVALSNYQRVLLVRLDFHMKVFTADNVAILNLFKKLKVSLKKRYSSQCHYLWVRERNTASAQHYHCVIALSGHSCRSSWYIYKEANRIWESIPHTASCFQPANPSYQLSRTYNAFFAKSLGACIYRISYLAKDATKELDVRRRFGSSSTKQIISTPFSLSEYYRIAGKVLPPNCDVLHREKVAPRIKRK